MKNYNSQNISTTRTKKKRKTADEDVNLDLQTVLFLENLGCSIVDMDEDMSFLQDNKEYKSLNPNIKSEKVTKNKKKSTDKSFPNELDPFYEVDMALPVAVANETAITQTSINAGKVQTLVTDLSSLLLTGTSTDTTSSTLQTQTVTSDNRQTTTKTKTQKTAAASSNTLPTQTATNDHYQTSTRLVNKT